MHHVLPRLAAAAALLAAGACASTEKPPAMTVIGTEMAFAAPERVPAGTYDVTFRNEGATYPELAFKNPSGRIVTRSSIAGGVERAMKVTLQPGRWELGCFEPGHYEQGMHKILVVDPA